MDELTAAPDWSEGKNSLHWSLLLIILISAPFGCFGAINPLCFIYSSLLSSVRLKLCHDWLLEIGANGFFEAEAQKPLFAHAANVNGICLLIIQEKLSKLLNERVRRQKVLLPWYTQTNKLEIDSKKSRLHTKTEKFFHPILFMFISLREGTAKKWLDT